ncbi:MAG: beta-N-acetylhexosaminidase [Candidatus Enteromonas sp.]|nr:beta-N-acetylhexosaminidase [Candidatus Enteromonas sp.]
MDLSQSVKAAIEFLGKDIFEPLELTTVPATDADVLEVEKQGKKARIVYGRPSSLFFGLTLLKLHRRKRSYVLKTTRRFQMQGYMHDCSRNGVMKVTEAKKSVLISALFGMDALLLYTEDTYEIPGEPYFGYLRGRYSQQEIAEIAEYAEGFGMEVIPCIQTLSHLNQALRWSTYQNVAETSQTLLVEQEATYQFIEKMVATCAKAFRSRRIHIGMDEAWDLGTGIFRSSGKAIDRKKAFLDHLRRVADICSRYGFHPMIWEDMLFRLHPEARPNWYENAALLPDEVQDLIPDVDLVYWDYYHDQKEVYDEMFEASLSSGKKVLFADGCFRWIGFAPNVSKSSLCTAAGLESAIEHQVKETFVTAWGDGGNEASIRAVYHTFALHSAFDFFGNGEESLVSNILQTILGYDLATWRLLETPNALRQDQALAENPSKWLFYQDVLLGLYDRSTKEEYGVAYLEKAKQLKKAAHKGAFPYMFQTLASLCDFLSVKAVVGKRLREAYQGKDNEGLARGIVDLSLCEKKLQKFIDDFLTQWETENKPFGLEVLQARFGALKERFAYAKRKIGDYLAHRIEAIPELEESLLPYEGEDPDIPMHNPSFANIFTSNVVS